MISSTLLFSLWNYDWRCKTWYLGLSDVQSKALMTLLRAGYNIELTYERLI